MRHADRPYLALDLETTGLSPWQGHRVIEIAAVVVRNGRAEGHFHSLIQPGVPIPRDASRIHGITTEMLRHAPPPEVVFDQFRRFSANHVLVAHNAPFDIGFLQAEMSRLGHDFNPPCRCTLKLARAKFPGLSNYRLETVTRHLLGSLPANTTFHRALDDARLVAWIWLEMNPNE